VIEYFHKLERAEVSMSNEDLIINNFEISSSNEVMKSVAKISQVIKSNTLIHIVSYMHNTVLVQNLKLEILKRFPEVKIVLLKHDDKSKTAIVLYSLKNSTESELNDEILNQLYLMNLGKVEHIKECKKNLLSRYFTDHLTHLPNLYQLRKDLAENENAGLIVINIDNFKTINNYYGFIVGDYVIEQVALYLAIAMQEKTVYRLSSVEFAIVLEQSLGFYDLKKYLTKIYDDIKSLIVNYQNINIYIDLTLASCANNTNADIFSKVSMALKYAEENHLPFWIYEDRMQFENEYELNLKNSSIVRIAVENFRIVPYFQSIIDNKTRKVVKYECLARLIDESDNIIAPTVFIPIAKRMKVYSEVTKAIINKSFEVFEDSEYEFTINLSMEDIMSSRIFEFIINKLKESSASHRVTFELLESEAIQDFKRMQRFITEVKRYGAKIAIDDFGSGYSNFAYLTQISVDYIKIDGSLIEKIDVDGNSLLVVETIVEFAKKLNIETIAEFVHSSTIQNKVQELGIDFSQGFYIDSPSVSFK
jgi:diguanylate cyclase (GGDEF)-like protein